jgi:hypothetical protein
LAEPEESAVNQIDKTIDVDVPVRTAYNQWTQFEDFPRFMSGVKEVRQLDDTHLHWRAEIWGKEKEWDAEITEQEPDVRISWKSTDGSWNAGTVRFESMDESRTRVRLAMGFEPRGVIENAGIAFGILSERWSSSRPSSRTAAARPGPGAAPCTTARRRTAARPEARRRQNPAAGAPRRRYRQFSSYPLASASVWPRLLVVSKA